MDPKLVDKAEALITSALSQLVLKHPFFAYLTLQRTISVTDAVPTAGADAKGRIYINPAFATGPAVGTIDKMVFLLAHEVMHIAFLHCHEATLAGRDRGAANTAMDKVINETLIAEKVGEFIEGGQRHPGAELEAWENLYTEPPEGGGGTGPGGIGEDLVPCPDGEPGEAEAERLKQEIKADLSAARNAAKVMGKTSAGIDRMVNELVHVRTPWHQILERFMTQFVAADYSWRKPNRRFVAEGMYLPSLDRVPKMGKIGIIGDTSGSIGDRVVAAFTAHMNRIIETCVPEEVIVLSVDASVAGVQRFDPESYPIKWSAAGGGGTDMREGWAWFEANEPELDCIVCLTDGHTPWPDSVSVPSIVLTTSEAAPTHVGETVTFNPDE